MNTIIAAITSNMDWPWILGSAVAFIFFIFFEWRAFEYPTKQDSLSRWVYNMITQFPLSLFWMGMFCGSLSTHFAWHWCPDLTPNGVGG